MTLQIVAPGPADGSHVYGSHTIEFSNGVAEVEELNAGVRAYMARKGYRIGAPGEIPEEEEQVGAVDLFDPEEHKVEDVLEYLADAESDEVQRVLAAEAEGKARKSVLEFEAEQDEEVSADGA